MANIDKGKIIHIPKTERHKYNGEKLSCSYAVLDTIFHISD